MARYNKRGELVSEDGRWLWVGGTAFDLKLEQWRQIDATVHRVRLLIGSGGLKDRRRPPGLVETSQAARLALEASAEWQRLEAMKAEIKRIGAS